MKIISTTGYQSISERFRQTGAGLFFLIFGLIVVLLSFIIHADDLAKNIMIGLGGYFAIVGLLVVVCKMIGLSSATVDLIFGLFGLWSFSVPAMLALPAIYYQFFVQNKMPWNEAFWLMPNQQFWLGLLFSILGLMLTLSGFLIIKYKRGGSIHFKSGSFRWGPGDPKNHQ